MNKLLINLGSGQRPFGPGWTNVDVNPKWKPDVVVDGCEMPMFKDSSADMIVSHHVLEHLWPDHATGMLRECYRILAPGGSLIVLVPNMRELVKAWITGRMDDQVFFTNVYGAFMGDQADLHRWGFSPDSLTRKLQYVGGWYSVYPFDFRRIEQADIAQDFWILGAEAVK